MTIISQENFTRKALFSKHIHTCYYIFTSLPREGITALILQTRNLARSNETTQLITLRVQNQHSKSVLPIECRGLFWNYVSIFNNNYCDGSKLAPLHDPPYSSKPDFHLLLGGLLLLLPFALITFYVSFVTVHHTHTHKISLI